MQCVEAIIRISEQGVTQPFYCRARDAEWWCKGWHTGIASLVREWVCANLAKTLDLPIPEFEILEVPLEVFDAWASFQDAPQHLVIPGQPYVFASRNVPNSLDVESPGTLPLGLTERLVLFDHAIRNLDRSVGNSNLLQAPAGESDSGFFLIDHNNAFDCNFSDAAFADTHIGRGRVHLSRQKALVFRQQLTAWTETSLRSVWDAMPEVWAEYGNLDIGPEKIAAALTERDCSWAEDF